MSYTVIAVHYRSEGAQYALAFVVAWSEAGFGADVFCVQALTMGIKSGQKLSHSTALWIQGQAVKLSCMPVVIMCSFTYNGYNSTGLDILAAAY